MGEGGRTGSYTLAGGDAGVATADAHVSGGPRGRPETARRYIREGLRDRAARDMPPERPLASTLLRGRSCSRASSG